MVARSIERHARSRDAPQCIGECPPIRIQDGEVVQPGRSRGRGDSARALPCIQPDMVVISPRAQKGGGVAEALGHLEPEHALIEGHRPFQIGDLQMNVPDSHPRMNWLAACHSPIIAHSPAPCATVSENPCRTVGQ